LVDRRSKCCTHLSGRAREIYDIAVRWTALIWKPCDWSQPTMICTS
jgi:hypothetical protein